jgi:hypothetical protein
MLRTVDRCAWVLRWLPSLVLLLTSGPAAAQVVVADAGDDLALECSSPDGTPATLDGLGSTVDGLNAALDLDADFLWEAPGIVFDNPARATPTATFPLGTTTVTLTITHTDPVTLVVVADQDTVDITVSDTTPPTLSLLADPAILWPPNHKLTPVEVILLTSDACDPDPDAVLTALTSSEPDNGTGDGDTVDDIQEADVGTDDREFLLRAERAGNGSGRVYSAIYNVTDASGNSTNGITEILVPHDQGDAKSMAAAMAAKAAEKAAKKAAKAAEKAAKQAAKAAQKAAKAAEKAAKKAAKGGHGG